VSDAKSGGLSGAFIPVPFIGGGQVPSYLTVSAWGHPDKQKQPDSWSKPDEPLLNSRSGWHSLGYIASLRATGGEISARMIGFTINKLPRQASRWHTHSGLTDFQLFVASINGAERQLIFKQQD
jgi:hypothetical protein